MDNSAPYITARHLDIGYASDTIVKDINFDLGRGEALALIGTNGSGKSTLLRTIVGLLQPKSGHIEVFGKPPAPIRAE
jgi:manganese/iron transport system ATP-binding protein/manganese transport system ATP-binding protein/manganese/zinc/iron transport system ATP- binding protein